MYEAAVNKKAEEIVTSLKKNKSDFVKRYGNDDAESVMYATANKVAQEETEEETWIDEYELKDGSLIEIDEEMMSILDEVYESLSEDHQDQFDVLFSENRETNTSLLEWVRSVK